MVYLVELKPREINRRPRLKALGVSILYAIIYILCVGKDVFLDQGWGEIGDMLPLIQSIF